MRGQCGSFCILAIALIWVPPRFAQAGDRARAPVSRVIQNIQLGVGLPITFNSAKATATTNDFRTGLAIAAKADLKLWDRDFSLMATFSKTNMFWFREDGAENVDVCKESFAKSLFSLPGYCTQYQTRLQPLVWFQSFAVGISFVYNHFTDISFKGSRIYNTKWAYGALGIVGGYRITRGRFSLLALANFDYGLFSQTTTVMTPTQTIQGVQVGLTIYGMYAFY